MKRLTLAAAVLSCLAPLTASAAEIRGEYLESRTCDVYTGPCFANGEIGKAGHEAVLAWKVDEGAWKGVDLDGLGVVLVVKANDTLGFNPSFAVKPFPAKSVILVDKKATPAQRDALIAFVKETAGKMAENVAQVETVAVSLKNDHLAGKGSLVAGELAQIETRKVAKGDCVCTNEQIFYPPLTKIDNMQPAVSLKSEYVGPGLNTTWTNFGGRNSFLGTFKR